MTSSIQKFCLSLPGDFFYFVEIHPTEASMKQAIKTLSGRVCKDAIALCLRYVSKQKIQGFEPIGTLYFQHRDRTNLGFVVHELTHAAIGYCNRTGLIPTNAKRKKKSDEEKFAQVLQNLVEQYQTKLNY